MTIRVKRKEKEFQIRKLSIWWKNKLSLRRKLIRFILGCFSSALKYLYLLISPLYKEWLWLQPIIITVVSLWHLLESGKITAVDSDQGFLRFGLNHIYWNAQSAFCCQKFYADAILFVLHQFLQFVNPCIFDRCGKNKKKPKMLIQIIVE